jgi:type VI secretion system secreted protein VgrG
MAFFELNFDCGESSLTVRRFSIHEATSTPFTVSVWVRSENPAVDISAIVGRAAIFRIRSGYAHLTGAGLRVWSGYVSYMEQLHAEHVQSKVQSTYQLRIVPQLWLLDQRRNHRIFQHLSIPDIVDKILDEWQLKRTWKIDRGQYPKHEFKVQYGETEFAFISRILEEAGIAYTFPDVDDNNSILTFSDALHMNPMRPGPPVPYEQNPTQEAERDFVSRVQLVHEVRPGALTIRDYDFRRPAFELFGEAPKAKGPEDQYEQYHYIAGGMFLETGKGGGTPVADDKGIARHDQPTGTKRATRMLESVRADREGIAFESNLNDLTPGMVFKIDNHPHAELGRKLLVTDAMLEGTAEGEWQVFGHAVFADVPYRPPLTTPRPEVLGVQTVRVVGPQTGDKLEQEIHVDEFGRVRVQFPWDRQGKNDDDSSCWIRVAEGWGGTGYGWMALPRVGHEVIVTFIEGDPDRPILSGRLYNVEHPVPYKLPEHKTVSTWKSDSSPTSNGFNEIKFEDMKGDELFYMQAEKNHRKLVKNDEFHTTGNDRDKTVIAIETETVGKNRMQWVQMERNEMIGSVHQTLIKNDRRQLIRLDESEVNEAHRKLLVLKDQDTVVKGKKRERDEWDLHVRVNGDRKDRTGKDHSLMVYQERHEKVGGSYAREAGKEIHYTAGKETVGEAPDVTVKGPGGFVRIDMTGVTISGTKVDINVSGRAGHGHGSHPKPVEEAIDAKTKTGVVRVAPDAPLFDLVKAIAGNFLDKPKPKGMAGVRYAELMKIAMSSDVSTPVNGTVLWSGGADKAGFVAEQLANQQTALSIPSKRLEMTPGGASLAVASNGDEWEVAQPAWQAISRRLAEGTSGEATVVVSYMPLNETAIFREEVKVLMANKNFTKLHVKLMQESPTGTFKDSDGKTYELVDVSLKEVLKRPQPKGNP